MPPRTPEERKVFETGVQEWIKPRVAKHKQLRGGVVVTDVIPKRFVCPVPSLGCEIVT
jgi:4-coumarate--CoA ligase